MDKFFSSLTVSDVKTLGVSFLILVFLMALAWRFLPDFITALNNLASAWREMAVAMTGLTSEIQTNRNACSLTQGAVRQDVQGIEGRIGGKLDEIHDLGVKNLKEAEETNTLHKVHSEKLDKLSVAVNGINEKVTAIAANVAKGGT